MLHSLKKKSVKSKEKLNNQICGLLFPTEQSTSKIKLFIIEKNIVKEIKSRSKNEYEISISEEQMINSSNIYGWMKTVRNSTKFYIVNKPDDFVAENKKTQRTGGVCGTALGAKDKNELISSINLIRKSMFRMNLYLPSLKLNKEQEVFLLNKKKINDTDIILPIGTRGIVTDNILLESDEQQIAVIFSSYQLILDLEDISFSMYMDKYIDKVRGVKIPNKTKTNILSGINLCEEIELLLRHRDNEKIFNDISSKNRYFYRLEEKMYISDIEE